MSYHPFIESGHKCPECGSRSICTMEDGFCENRGACDNCLRNRYRSYSLEDFEYEEHMERTFPGGYDD